MKTAATTTLPLAALALTLAMGACTHEPVLLAEEEKPVVPGCTTNGEVCFESNVLPIFIASCARSGCHDATTREEDLVLDTYTHIVREGIVPGDAEESKLYKVLFETGEDQMPPDAPLTQAQKDSIRLWINQGAKNTVDCACACNTSSFAYGAVIEPILANKCVGCHKPGYLGGGINLVGYSNVKVQADNGFLAGVITHAGGYLPMPQGGKLPECEIGLILQWIAAGAPNN